MARVCVFCGSSTGNDARFAEAAREVGALLGRRGLGLVFGGGKVGLMGVVADAALAAGAEVIGVLPRGLEEKEVAHLGLSRLEITVGMHARKQRMYELSDAFVVLPGGYGTMDEMFEVLTWNQIGAHKKRVGILDVGGFYRPLFAFLDAQVEAGLLRPEYRGLLTAEDDATRLLDNLLPA